MERWVRAVCEAQFTFFVFVESQARKRTREEPEDSVSSTLVFDKRYIREDTVVRCVVEFGGRRFSLDGLISPSAKPNQWHHPLLKNDGHLSRPVAELLQQ
ncbi:hypothetical protein PPL_05559 [Heterostelium album PN500]|uniref:Uncharacterized protein n=1 Tax=Heterostelium pallidum (strain ATCC 26659 / Pp 5 / PN500) TaxID=670386 RepID=D3BAI2_HETP5|nr:hypothetical protein PPL_05559 [Heterostelium album PN500]EFA81569.1 hypothetical protein PPL_05559 [Heterostelium album PN500]|eukprot:XP_020433686.1 hypothetical protein PPL_05559 [Heterostelium album PN500]